MTKTARLILAIAATAATGVGALTGAQAQYYAPVYQPEPLYPYVVQPHYSYPAQPQYAPRAYPYVRPNNAPSARRPQSKVDRALVEELRQGARGKRTVINKKIIVRERPIIIEKQRVVDDPPIVIQRHVTEDQVRYSRRNTRAEKLKTGARVIRAEAEVTILGPDSMSIRVFRKRGASDANANAAAD
jgi:hypothetical protein